MSRRYLPDDDNKLGGGCVAGFALTIVMTLTAFFLANAGLFASEPLARAGSPPRGDVIILSNGETAQVISRLRAARLSGFAQSKTHRPSGGEVAGKSADYAITSLDLR